MSETREERMGREELLRRSMVDTDYLKQMVRQRSKDRASMVRRCTEDTTRDGACPREEPHG